MQIVFFEDQNIEKLNPIALTRPGFDIFCAAITLLDLAKKLFPRSAINFIVRNFLEALCLKKHGQAAYSADEILFLNSALVPDIKQFLELKKIVGQKSSFKIIKDENVLALYINLKTENQDISVKQLKKLTAENISNFFTGLKIKTKKLKLTSFDHLSDLIKYNRLVLADNLNYFKNDFKKISENVYVGKKVKIDKLTTFDASLGPIIIDSGSAVNSFVFLKGPVYIGKNSLVKEFTSINNSCFGPVCKLGGEITGTAISGYSNKQHYGFLGDSYIGQWVNIAAGTTNSDLKNSYSPIKMAGENTGEIFLGCVIADYSKTSINASIYPGKIIGVNSCIYGWVTTDVPSFTNYNKSLKFSIEFRFDAAVKCQKAMMARRKIKQSAIDIKLLEYVYKLTASQRKKQGIAKGDLIL